MLVELDRRECEKRGRHYDSYQQGQEEQKDRWHEYERTFLEKSFRVPDEHRTRFSLRNISKPHFFFFERQQFQLYQ